MKPEQQNNIDFAEITFAVPAQEFGITCSLSTEEALPVVTETALRLVHACETISMQQLQSYFGFSHREITAVVNTLLSERLVAWDDDALQITPYARGRFIESEDAIPRFFRIKDWSRDIVFDLMSFMPGDTQSTRLQRPYAMVELTPKHLEKESQTKVWAERSFQENFHRVYRGSRAEIYKISDVGPGERFYLPLSCRFSIDTTQGLQVTRSFSDKSFEDRLEVAEAISAVLASKERLDNSGVRDFIELFEDPFMRRFDDTRRFDFNRYLNDIHIFPSEKVADQIAPLIGALHIQRNRKMIIERLKLTEQTNEASAFWIAPQTRLWSRSRLVRNFLRDVTAELKTGPGSQTDDEEARQSRVRMVLQAGGIPDTNFTDLYRDTFPEVYTSFGQALGGRVEILLIPKKLMCALYHYQLDDSPMTVPIGFISTAPDHIARATEIAEVLCDGRVPIYKLERKKEMKAIPHGILRDVS